MIKSRQLPLSTKVSEPNYCFIDTRIREVKGLKLACIGREQCNPNYHVHRRGYSCLCLEFVAKGSGKVTLGGKSFTLRPGMVFTYGPNVAHDITTLPEQPMLKYFVSFFGSESLPLLHRAGLPVWQGCSNIGDGSACVHCSITCLRKDRGINPNPPRFAPLTSAFSS